LKSLLINDVYFCSSPFLFAVVGIDSIAFDPQRFAMDYHIIGFRECATEVARYLVTFEGMDIQDPLRLRLMSHLQCFVAQWEVKSNNTYQSGYHTPPSYQNYPTSHTTATSTSNNYYPTPPNPTTPIHLQHASSTMSADTTNATCNTNSIPAQHQQQTSHHHSQQQQHYATAHENAQLQQQQQVLQQHPDNLEPTYTDLSSSVHSSRLSTVSLGYGNPQYPSSSAQTYGHEVTGAGYNGNGKQNPPYRPWGAEMAY
jgi:hairy and enhancer of split related with YRPW motif